MKSKKSSKYEAGHNAGTLHLVQDSGNSSALAMELLQSWTKPSMYCYRKPALASWDDKYTVGSGTIHAGVL